MFQYFVDIFDIYIDESVFFGKKKAGYTKNPVGIENKLWTIKVLFRNNGSVHFPSIFSDNNTSYDLALSEYLMNSIDLFNISLELLIQSSDEGLRKGTYNAYVNQLNFLDQLKQGVCDKDKLLSYTCKNFNSEYKINLIMVLICLTNFKTGIRGFMNNRCLEPLESDCSILNNLSLSLDERLFKSQVDYENFVFSQEIGQVLNNSLCIELNSKTSSIGEGALISINLILKLWEKNAKIRKMYLSDFIRGINIDMPNPNSLSNLFFEN